MIGGQNNQVISDYQVVKEDQFSDLYMACERGDADSVREIGLKTDYVVLNKREPNGSTALHAACSLGNVEVVRVLLHEFVVVRHQRNLQGRTAYEEATTDEIRQLFHRPSSSERFCDQTSECDVKGSFCVMNYNKKKNDKNSLKRIRFIGKTEGKGDIDQIRTGIWLMKRTVASQTIRPILLEIGRRLSPQRRYHDEKMVLEIMIQFVEEKMTKCPNKYHCARMLLNVYAQSWNVEPLFTLYSLDSPFYSYMGKNTSGLFGLFYGLHKLKPRSF